MTTCYSVGVNETQRTVGRRRPQRGRALTEAEVEAVNASQALVERLEAELDAAVDARNSLWRGLRSKGVMASQIGQAVQTPGQPDGMHRTTVQRKLRGDQ
jgi:hypothetical protein